MPVASPPQTATPKPAAKKVTPLRAFGAPGAARKVRHPFAGKGDTRRRRKLKDIARTLPRTPGVYFFFGFNDRLLYIGKAKCLRERVRSYFGESALRRPPKLRLLLAEVKRLEWQECGSELEALLVERRLIAERLPILNRQHKRFAVYPYLLLSDEAFPRLTLTRAEPVEEGTRDGERGARDESHPSSLIPHPSNLPLETPPHAGALAGLYLGPFTSPRVAAWTFEAVRAVFPLRSCEGDIRPDVAGRSCFYHEIGRCCGPCIEATPREAYARLCADLIALLQSGEAPQLDALRARMQRLSEQWRFEDAAQIKEQLAAIEAVAARLQRLQRMRRENNVVIAQPAVSGIGYRVSGLGESAPLQREAAASTPKPETRYPIPVALFLVQGGVVRRHLMVSDWSRESDGVKRAVQEVFSAPPPAADFTAKTELDEMMILDRWLKAHRDEPCCVAMNDRTSRRWAGNAVRRLRVWAAGDSRTVGDSRAARLQDASGVGPAPPSAAEN